MKERIRKLRERVTSSSCSLCIERAKFYTQAMRERGDEPIICRRAKALANILRNMKVQIFPDELIVGTFVSKPPGAIFYPELIGLLVMPEIDQIRDRKVNPLLISDDEIVILKKEIAPYWKSRTISDKARSYFSNEVKRVIPTLSPFLLTEANGISHTTPNYPFLIKKGFKEIGEIASKKEDDFFKAVEIVCQALCEFSNRYAAEAERMADEEKNDKRKEELVRISKICRQVPAYPPRDFQEALQFVWFTQLALYQENVDVGISIGRVDQFLLPFFRKDVEKIGEEGIKELIQCFWVKINELVNCRPSVIDSIYFSGVNPNQTITIGGVDSDGKDATNELSYLLLEATDELRMRGPNVNIRFNNNSPENFRREVSKVIRGGGNIIATVNDEIAIKAQNKRGVSLEDARDYSVTGCVEITSAGRIFSSSDAALFNLPFCLELALFNGRSQRTSKVETVVQLPLLQRFLFKLWLKFGRMGVKSGAPSSFNSMDDVINAFKKQVAYFVRLMVEGSNALERAHKEWLPTPLLSICLDGCLEKGIDVNEGGAKYNFTGVQAVGIADVADSLFAIDKIIFKEKRMSFKELSTLLKKNFRGEEEKRLLLWNSPKYGNDLDEVDFYAKMVAEIFDKEVSKYENPRGGMFFPGIYSIGTQVGFGKAVGASPSGRKAGEPLATGINPHQGCDQKGPTATLRSISKIDHSLFANGIAVNMEINPKTVEGDAGIDILSALIKSFFRIGGLHIHFNIIDKKTLINAQKNPARYQDLLIRVGGFSARFVALSKEHQDEIISRTEHYVQPDF